MLGGKMKKVIVYSTKSGPYCIMVKDYLKHEKVNFEDIDVGSNHDKAQEMIEKSGQYGVPVVELDGKVIIGFDKHKIEQTLKKGGYFK